MIASALQSLKKPLKLSQNSQEIISPLRFRMMKRLLLALAFLQSTWAEMDTWDLPPTRYSETVASDAVSKLATDLASGKRKVEGASDLEKLRFVLKELNIAESSQVLVFSKTSLQNSLIHPRNPRALYFSEEAYVGYVPGGMIEAIVQDPLLGTVFYTIDLDANDTGAFKIERDTNSCLSCHGNSSTESAPGLRIRSVYPDEEGHALLAMGSISQVTHETPLTDRWGGYYVTGTSTAPHLGNRTFIEDGPREPRPSALKDLTEKISVSKYPKPTSDIIALLVLEHQCKMHNLLNAATVQYRRVHFLGKAFDASADPDQASAGRVADSLADRIVDCIFFKDEALPGEGIEGGEEFQTTFTARYPKTQTGESIAEFQLDDRIFKRRCSFMVYSSAFKNLPPRVKSAVLEKMHVIIDGKNPAFDYLKVAERKRIDQILSETLPGWS